MEMHFHCLLYTRLRINLLFVCIAYTILAQIDATPPASLVATLKMTLHLTKITLDSLY